MVETSIWKGPAASLSGAGMVSRMVSKSGFSPLRSSSRSRTAKPSRPTA